VGLAVMASRLRRPVATLGKQFFLAPLDHGVPFLALIFTEAVQSGLDVWMEIEGETAPFGPFLVNSHQI
jgi:hypothetical protein